jgi:hypothetical protein
MYMLVHISDDDDDYVQVVETTGQGVGKFKQGTKEITSGETKPRNNSIDQSTNKEK